jgi:hypothetical protein
VQGPVTVFEGSSYAGDARIADLQPNCEPTTDRSPFTDS